LKLAVQGKMDGTARREAGDTDRRGEEERDANERVTRFSPGGKWPVTYDESTTAPGEVTPAGSRDDAPVDFYVLILHALGENAWPRIFLHTSGILALALLAKTK
jgi:hypothetical protein